MEIPKNKIYIEILTFSYIMILMIFKIIVYIILGLIYRLKLRQIKCQDIYEFYLFILIIKKT